MDNLELFQRFAAALAIGALIGLERGWSERTASEGSRVAGIRTFALTGLLGGVWMLLAEEIGIVVLGFAFAAYAAVMIIARVRASRQTGDVGATTIVAAMLTFALGAIAVAGEMAIAAASGVVTALLLGFKAPLHDWLQRIDREELLAVLKLLAMTLVLLPVLPNQGYGPWQVFNPFEMWLMVILVAGISLLGYTAIRIAGRDVGIPLAGLLAGLASSTAATVTFSRFAKINPRHSELHNLGIILAATVMFPRAAVLVAAVNPAVLVQAVWPLAAAAAVSCIGALVLWLRLRSRKQPNDTESPELQNPFEFLVALRFGLLLAAILFLARALLEFLGEQGIYLLATVSGLADVDAITLSVSRMARADITPQLAAAGVVIACASNTLVKIGISVVVAGYRHAVPVCLVMGASAAAALAVWAVK